MNEESKYDQASNAVQKTSPPAISTLYIAVVSGVILVLLLLLIFGVAWRQGNFTFEFSLLKPNERAFP